MMVSSTVANRIQKFLQKLHKVYALARTPAVAPAATHASARRMVPGTTGSERESRRREMPDLANNGAAKR